MVVLALCRRVTKSEQAPDGHPWPQTRAEANKLIEALKAMRQRGWRPNDVEPSEVGVVETGADEGIAPAPPCSLPAHDRNVLGQCAQAEAASE